MLRLLSNAYRLGVKELYSLRHDSVLLFLIVYSFTYAVYGPAKGARMELVDASVAVVDEDRSTLSHRIEDALMRPYFLLPGHLSAAEVEAAMDADRYTFVIDIPPRFQADVLAGRTPAIQVNVDATAMSQAGRGAGYLESVIAQELQAFLHPTAQSTLPAARLVVQAKYNPNLMSSWFNAVMQIVNNITMLAIILSGAALMREREHGTIEHLLVMPLTPVEIMLGKVWPNALVIVAVSAISLRFIVQGCPGRAHRRVHSVVHVLHADLHVLGHGARHLSRDAHPVDAPVWSACLSRVHRHESVVRGFDTARQHARAPAGVHADFTHDPLRRCFADDSVSGSRSRSHVAAPGCGRRNRTDLLSRSAAAVS